MAVSKRTRFEVLRRDNHTCRYCGASAPQATLQVDHVTPKALGGGDGPENLITACRECNAGKASIAADSAIVADVERAALVWSRAMALAAERLSYDEGLHSALLSYFETEWVYYTESDIDEAQDSLPADWRSSIVTFTQHGLGVTELDEAREIAQSKKNLPWTARWSYFCGICWTKIREIQREAQRLIDTGVIPR